MRHTYGNADGDSNSYAYTDGYANGHSNRNAVSDANLRTGRTDNNTLCLE